MLNVWTLRLPFFCGTYLRLCWFALNGGGEGDGDGDGVVSVWNDNRILMYHCTSTLAIFSVLWFFFFGLNWIKLASGACYPGWSRRFGEFATPRRGVVGPFRSVLMYSSCPSFSAGLLRRDGLKLLTSVTMSESIVIEQLKIDELEARLYNTCAETKFHIIKHWGRHTVTVFVWKIGIRLYKLKCIVDNQTGGRKIHQKIFCHLYTWYIIGANCSWVYLLSAT